MANPEETRHIEPISNRVGQLIAPAHPVFSIVTPCLNRVGSIGRAVESVLAQNYPAFEHLVVDGCSTDGTWEVLKRYPHLRVVSEKDRNLYDAINKGMRMAGGDVVALLNSDDLYPTGAFTAVAEALADPTIEMVIGGAEIFAVQGGRDVVLSRFIGERATGLSEANAIGNVTVMNSSFWRPSLLERVGLFDDRFRLAADKDFWMRLVLAAPRHRLLKQVLYRYLSHEGSLTFSGADQRDALSLHLLNLARTRFPECTPGTPAYAAYRRWHALAVGYRAMRDIAHGRMAGLMGTAREGFSVDPLWPARFLARLPVHWFDRAVRRGETN